MPMETGLWPLQVAIYQRLSNDADLMAMIKAVYDEVPEVAEGEDESVVDSYYPYVQVGEPVVNIETMKNSYIENIPWVLHSFDRYLGKKQAYDILNTMLKSLTKAPLQVEGFKLHDFRVEPNMQVIKDVDGRTNHGILRVRFFIEKN